MLPTAEGQPCGAEGGPCCSARRCPSWGGCAQALSSPLPGGQGCSRGGLRDAECSRAALWGAQSPPPLVPRVPASLPSPCCAGAGPGEAAGWLQAGRKGNGREFKRRVFNLEQLATCLPPRRRQHRPRSRHRSTQNTWLQPLDPLLWGSLAVPPPSAISSGSPSGLGTLGYRYPLVP